MLVATVFFVIGKPFYVNKPPEGSITTKVIGSISHATYKRFTSSDKKEHWMDHAKEKYEKSLVEDVKTLLRVLVIFIPIPVFWALFDQQVRSESLHTSISSVICWIYIKILPSELTEEFYIFRIRNGVLIRIVLKFYSFSNLGISHILILGIPMDISSSKNKRHARQLFDQA